MHRTNDERRASRGQWRYWLGLTVLLTLGVLLVRTGPHTGLSGQEAQGRSPNIVFIMADELGYYELSCMGHPNIQTPNIDQMAAGGMRFTQFLAGSPLCAPTRGTLLTGKHSGHTSVRSNGGGTPLRAGEETIGSVLKSAGYATGGFGKWGCGGRGSSGVPEKHGFDTFVGYYDQVHAHSYYPPYIIHNSEEVPLEGNRGGSKGKTYSHYVIMDAAKKFIRKNKDKPFFCYLPVTPPHGLFNIPDDDPAWKIYADKDWPESARRYAAMVTMLDRQMGEILTLLRELGLADNTIVMFAGDNGGNDYFKDKLHPRGFHAPNVDPKTGTAFRGRKGQLYEGGLRIPMIAYWPGRIRPGQVSKYLGYFPDLLPTYAELAGAKVPGDVDGISIVPELLGEEVAGRKQELHKYLYWELGQQVAVREGSWKALRARRKSPWALYDLKKDISETRDVAAKNAAVLARLKGFAELAHEPVRVGDWGDRSLHEKDRRAKGGRRRGRRGAARIHDLPKKGLIPRDGWKLLKFSSQSEANGKLAKNAFDGNPRTHWHTSFGGNAASYPHELLIDMGVIRTVRGFVYLARQDAGWNGTIASCEFFVGEALKDLGKGKATATTTFKKVKTAQTLDCSPVKGRYILIRARSEIADGPWASAAEIGVLGQ